MLDADGNEVEQDAGAFWKDFIRDTAPEFRRPTVEQLESFVRPTFEALVDGAKYCEPQLREIVARTRPDVVVEDNVVAFPALLTAGMPFVRIVSCNPLEVPGPGVPPVFSGLPAADDAQWGPFRAEYDRVMRPAVAGVQRLVRRAGQPPAAGARAGRTRATSRTSTSTPRRPTTPAPGRSARTWHRMDSSVRETDEAYELPAAVADRPEGSALLYVSLGSLGGADIDLMRRLVDSLARTPHRYVVSMGPRADELELAPNMVGAEFLPQTRIIPLVDAVVTHGGNNTTTESLHFGRPMVLLPIFWDQYDNAQRMDELGFGVRLDTYRFTDAEMAAALSTVLGPAMRARVAAVGDGVRARDGLRRGADVIEAVGFGRTP